MPANRCGYSSDGVGGLAAGETKIWVCVMNDGFNFDSFALVAASGIDLGKGFLGRVKNVVERTP